MRKKKPWGWFTRYRHRKDAEPLYLPDFLRWWRKRDKTTVVVDAAMLTMVAVLVVVAARG